MLMLIMNKNSSFRSHQLANAMIFAYCGILLRISYYFATQTLKCSLKSVHLCKFALWSPDVIADKWHP